MPSKPVSQSDNLLKFWNVEIMSDMNMNCTENKKKAAISIKRNYS